MNAAAATSEGPASGARQGQAQRIPVVRAPAVEVDGAIPRHWFGGNVVASHVANGVNMLFPAGERFFVRSVKRFLDGVADPLLREQARGFFGQEGRHAKEHERWNRILVEQGYHVEGFLRAYEAIAFGLIEKVAPAELSLAVTAACEHFTALMAENALDKRFLDAADPTMRGLLLWHAAEEIEHRAVAFDVLQRVNPSYALRISGLALASLCLGGFWAAGAATLLWQERELGATRLLADWRAARQRGRATDVFAVGIREYLRRDFHPLDKPIDGLAAEYLAQAGLA